jgi:NADPH:quinone reductase-like Zn-dependent oxidoreductase
VWEGKDQNPAASREELQRDLADVFGLVAAGQLAPAIAATYPLAQASDALRYAESGQAMGKVVLIP